MIYFFLIFLILILDLLTKNFIFDREKRNKTFVFFSFLAIFLICVLRASTVGRDIPGYKEMYEYTALINFSNFDYVYFEKGYVFLMKICNLIGMNFQWFLFVIYLIMLVPIGVFVYKFSREPLLSIIVFVCYMFFEFYLTGLRQAISMSIILTGIIVLLKRRKFSFIYFYAFLFLASFFHAGALICLPLPFLLFEKRPLRLFAISILVAIAILPFRNVIFSFVKGIFDKDSIDVNAQMYVGLNLITLLLFTVIYIFISQNNKSNSDIYNFSYTKDNENALLNILIFGVFIAFVLGFQTSARSYMYYSISIIVLLPNIANYFDAKGKKIIRICMVSFLIVYFTYSIINENNFDIMPYKFFWY